MASKQRIEVVIHVLGVDPALRRQRPVATSMNTDRFILEVEPRFALSKYS
jgi:hypothetical protein